eukprot:CAMPEP_0184685490 /NCGR_PEP_ID=MMETSP0312-20130426/19170_1 /TAXON_ID=31354 /ORGANISM="Compsopogon coeruleus, Strain SAG 36.94" /LENGTH=51 /DNA_ID=CAMNT_0027139643 /DNA_START=338 /DNA_END=491 /DNA_ORIENTATION=-
MDPSPRVMSSSTIVKAHHDAAYERVKRLVQDNIVDDGHTSQITAAYAIRSE